MSGTLKTVFSTLKAIYKYGVPSHILYFGDSLGDNLLLTTLASALNARGYANIWIKCDHSELFDHNPHVKLVLPFNALLSRPILKMFHIRLLNPTYSVYQPESDRDRIPEKHILLKMADVIDLKGEIASKPVLNLRPDEERAGRIALQHIVVVTSTAGAKVPMRNKEWLIDRYQQLVDRLSPGYKFIQIGASGDHVLNNVLDLTGKTTLRESAAILKNASLLIGHVGFMMHMARAVDCRAVVIFGGRESPAQSGYACFNNIYNAVPCSPCWLHNTCDHERKCMTEITAAAVEQAVLMELKLTDKPMAVDILYNA